MRADDVSPNRLGAAKQFAAALAARHPGARFGLVVFAGTGQSRVPLTDDLDLFAAEVGGLEATDGPGEGTALGDALALGAERLRAAVNPAQAALPWQRLVLITDGANHAGRDPETVALHLARESIGLGVVGVGSEKTTVRREWDEVTQARRPLQDAYGRNQTWEPLDAAGLQRLAARAGGLFVRADDPRGAAALDPLFARAPGPAPVRTAPGPPRHWFWLPLAAALLALGSEFALAKTLFRPLQDA
jgi:Ca-activated chloride channel family protein